MKREGRKGNAEEEMIENLNFHLIGDADAIGYGLSVKCYVMKAHTTLF